jgi:hypothetical protein
MRYAKFLLLTTVCAVFVANAAKAEVYQWGNPGISLTVTFPDTWRRVGNQQPDDVMTIAAPGDFDYATCRLRVNNDRRFVIYPRAYAAAVQHKNFSHDFWEGYSGQYRSAQINQVVDDAGLGQGFGSWADISFVAPSGPKVQMRGIMFAANYNDNTYVFECSSEASTFGKWFDPFSAVLNSIDMRPEYTTKVNGHYRDFQNDGKWKIHGQREIDLFIYP